MSIKSILKNHQILEEDIERIIRYGLSIIDKKSKRSNFFNVDEKNVIIEGLLLRACATWERFLEKEIIYLVDMDKSMLLEEFELPSNTKLNQKIIKAILFSTGYRDFHDIERSKIFFRTFIVNKYNLFVKISNGQIKKNRMVYRLRNYLAHYSEFAKKKLHQEYIKSYNYSLFMQPGKFLMKKNGRFFESLIHNFNLISATMKKGLK